MQIIVVSNSPFKRIEYFVEAGRSLQTGVRFMTYEELFNCLPSLRQAVVKLEPWVSCETDFLKYTLFNDEYKTILQRLDTPHSFDELAQALSGCSKGCFLKQRYGSGAGGIMAIRYQPRQKKWVVYTTLQKVDRVIHNTKRIHRLTKEQDILPLAEAVMHTGAILEEWIPKEQLQGENYDLRVVSGEEEIDYVVVRCSKGGITNLHLNNNARLWSELPLSEDVRQRIYLLCRKAVRTLGLRYGGVDVLIERGTDTIEVNGQGDHIYQDMYAHNSIYTRQIRTIKKKYDHADR